MVKLNKRLRSRRIFSEEFKKARVEEYERGQFTVKEITELYKVSNQAVYHWIYKYSTFNKKKVIVVESSKSSQNKLKELQQRIKELERAVGQKQLHIDYLEKMIEIAQEDLKVDIKKNSNTQPSTGSGKTGKKKV